MSSSQNIPLVGGSKSIGTDNFDIHLMALSVLNGDQFNRLLVNINAPFIRFESLWGKPMTTLRWLELCHSETITWVGNNSTRVSEFGMAKRFLDIGEAR